MMKVLLSGLFFMLLMCTCQCNRISPKPQSPLLGRYELIAHDNSGRLAFTGSISLVSHEQNFGKGQCTIVIERNAPDGLLDNNGDCEGEIDGKMISIDSAPALDDAGLLLEGQFNDERITGIWRIDGFASSPPLGKFEAVKKG